MSGLEQLRARSALAQAGVPAEGKVVRAPSVNNSVWLSDTHVVRMSSQPDRRLHREAMLLAELPDEIATATPVGCGVIAGVEYFVLERVAGAPLSHCWPEMATDDRRRAISDLADILARLHRVPTPPDLPDMADPPQPVGIGASRPVEPILEAIDRACRLDRVDQLLLREVAEHVERLSSSLRSFPRDTLVHGDLSLENVLWSASEGRVSALIDFEWARGAPPDLDLDVLLLCCARPALFVAPEHEGRQDEADYRTVPAWLAEDYPSLFATPNLLSRLRIYAFAFAVRELLHNPPAVRPDQLPEAHPLPRLRRLLDGTSHLDRLLPR